MIAPASIWTSVIYPDTRGRISTDSTASRRPVNSSHSFTSFSITVTTLTGSGPCDGADSFLHPADVRRIDNIPTPINRFFTMAFIVVLVVCSLQLEITSGLMRHIGSRQSPPGHL